MQPAQGLCQHLVAAVLDLLQEHLAVADDVAQRRPQLMAGMSEDGEIAVAHAEACRPSSASIFPRSRASSMGLVS